MVSRILGLTILAGGVLSVPALAGVTLTDGCGGGAPALVLNEAMAGTTVGASPSDEDITPSYCGTYDSSGGLEDVFARFTPVTTGTYRFTTCGSATNTIISVHSGCPATDANLLDCTDDQDTCSNGTSTVTVRLTAGTTYHVRVATPFTVEPGPFSVTASSVTSVANDECSGAIAISPGGSLNGTNVGATGTSFVSCFTNANSGGADVWYSLNVTTPGVYTIDLTPTDGQSMSVSIQSGGCPGSSIACSWNDFTVNHPRVIEYLDAGTHYLRIAGWRGFSGTPAEGAFSLAVSTPAAQLGNDECANATVINPGGTVSGTTVGATPDGSSSSCGWQNPYEVWYRLNITQTAEYLLTLNADGNWSAGIALFSGSSCGTKSEIACTTSSVRMILSAGTNYYVRVAGDLQNTGTFSLSLDSGTFVPANDLCSNAAIATVGTTNGTNAAASGDDETPDCAFSDTRDVWYTFTAPSAGYYTFDTLGSVMENTVLSIYGTSSTCNTTTGGIDGDPLVCSNNISDGDPYNPLSLVSLSMTSGQQVRVRVAGESDSFGAFKLNIAGPGTAPAVPPHDTYNTPRIITGFTYTDTTDARSANRDQFHDCTVGGLPETYYGVWYKHTAVEEGVLVVDETAGSIGRSLTSFYQASPGSLPILNLPLQCDTVTLEVQPGDTNLFLVATRSVEFPSLPYVLSATFEPQLGCCQTPSGCVIQAKSTCTGTWTESLCGPTTTYTGSQNLPLTIPNPATNNNPVYVNSALTISDTTTISNLSVTVGLNHINASHVVMRLITPWGTTIQLLTGNNSAQTFNAFNGTYTFSEIGLRSLSERADQNPLPNTTYPPLNPIGSVVAGHPANGTWTLAIGDETRNGSATVGGTLNSWSITINGQCVSSCPADFNNVNGVTVQDIFDFLTAWLAGSPTANFNGVNGVTVQDIFDFLTAWLAGC